MLEALAALAIGQLGWRAGTPTPVLPAEPRWVEMYWHAWENLHANVKEETSPSDWPPRAIVEEGAIHFDRTLAIALYARWGWRANPVGETLSYALSRVAPDGSAPATISLSGERGSATGVPIAALAARRVAEITGDETLMARITGPVLRRNAYIAGQFAYTIPAEEDGKQAGVGYKTPPQFSAYPSPIESPGEDSAEALGMLLMDTASLARLFAAARQRDQAATAGRLANAYAKRLEALYRSEHKRFAASDEEGSLERDGLAPLWGGIGGRLPQRDALRGLLDPTRFYRRTLFPTVARGDRAYADRSGTSVLHTYLALRAMIDGGMQDDAGRAAEAILRVVDSAAGSGLSLYEAYGPETRAPAPEAAPNGLLAGVITIAALIEAVLGFEANAIEKRVDWNLRRRDRHGIEGLRFGRNVVSLIAEAEDAGGGRTLSIECTEAFTLRLIQRGKHQEKRFSAGKHSWQLGAR